MKIGEEVALTIVDVIWQKNKKGGYNCDETYLIHCRDVVFVRNYHHVVAQSIGFE